LLLNWFSLHEEMLDFQAYISPCEEEKAMRLDVIQRFKQSVLELWPDAKVGIDSTHLNCFYLAIFRYNLKLSKFMQN